MAVYYLDEIFDYISKQQLQSNFNMLHLPNQLNLKILPNDVKQVITKKLQAYTPDKSIQPHLIRYWEEHVNSVINFMNTTVPDDAAHFQTFHYYTRGLDRTRGQSFEKQLPEFAAILKPWFDQLDAEITA